MSIDIYNSRRVNYHKCTFWLRDENGLNDDDELIHNKKPDGTFYARELSEVTKNNIDINNVWQVDVEEVILQTTDYVEKLKKNDLVEFDGLLYRVDYVKSKHIHKRNEFAKSNSLITTIHLRR